MRRPRRAGQTHGLEAHLLDCPSCCLAWAPTTRISAKATCKTTTRLLGSPPKAMRQRARLGQAVEHCHGQACAFRPRATEGKRRRGRCGPHSSRRIPRDKPHRQPHTPGGDDRTQHELKHRHPQVGPQLSHMAKQSLGPRLTSFHRLPLQPSQHAAAQGGCWKA